MISQRPRSKLRRLVLAGAFLALAALALVLLRLSPQTSQGAGTSSADGLVAAVNISFGGTCNPGAIATPSNPNAPQGIGTDPINAANPLQLPVTTPVSGCISRAGCPDTVMIGNERFAYANVSALTLAQINSGSPGPTFFTLAAENLPPPPITTSGCAQQFDFPNNFPSAGQIYVDHELFTYDSVGTAGFHITYRAGSALHTAGTLIRAANQIQLLGRGGPKYPASVFAWLATPTVTPLLPTPTYAAHTPGASVGSPKTYLTCRELLSQPAPPAGAVQATSRCYFIQQPGYNESVCATPVPPPAPAACFWPNAPMQQNAIRQWSVAAWSAPTVVDQGSTAAITLTAEIQPSINNCFPYVEGLLWAKMTAQITLQKSGKSYGSGSGTFAIAAYTDDQCLTSPIFTLTDGSPNFVATTMPTPVLPAALPPVPTPDAADTDGDGCPDFRELGGVPPAAPAGMQTTGGMRDPFNPWDYPDMPIASNREKIRVDDVTFVVNRYRHDAGGVVQPLYDPKADHTVLSPSIYGQTWHLGPPNGQIRVDDVTSVVNQYRQDCS